MSKKNENQGIIFLAGIYALQLKIFVLIPKQHWKQEMPIYRWNKTSILEGKKSIYNNFLKKYWRDEFKRNWPKKKKTKKI